MAILGNKIHIKYINVEYARATKTDADYLLKYSNLAQKKRSLTPLFFNFSQYEECTLRYPLLVQVSQANDSHQTNLQISLLD